jgi:hypothetical protein
LCSECSVANSSGYSGHCKDFVTKRCFATNIFTWIIRKGRKYFKNICISFKTFFATLTRTEDKAHELGQACVLSNSALSFLPKRKEISFLGPQGHLVRTVN